VTKFVQALKVGFAFVLLKREVVERMCEAYPELEYETRGAPREWALFLDMLEPAKGGLPERLSEDYSFCKRWIDIGGEIWLDPESSLIHAGRAEFTGSLNDVFQAMAVRQAAE
jgi:hypothetical protein